MSKWPSIIVLIAGIIQIFTGIRMFVVKYPNFRLIYPDSAYLFIIVGVLWLIIGVLLIVSSVNMKKKEKRGLWNTLALVFSCIGLNIVGIIGSIAGIITSGKRQKGVKK